MNRLSSDRAFAAEGVGDKVRLPSYVLDVCGELCDGCQMSLLTWTVRIRNLPDSGSERVMVGVYSKLPTFQKISKVSDGGVHS